MQLYDIHPPNSIYNTFSITSNNSHFYITDGSVIHLVYLYFISSNPNLITGTRFQKHPRQMLADYISICIIYKAG